MEVKEELKEKLNMNSIGFLENKNFIKVLSRENGFDVGLYVEKENHESYTVFCGDNYHMHFEEREEAINFLMFGLSSRSRLRVEYCGDKGYKWSIQYKSEDDDWKLYSETGILNFVKPFWKKKSVKYFQNDRL